MSRSPLFATMTRAFRIARFCDDQRLSTADGLARIRAAEERYSATRRSRREMLKALVQTGAAGAAATVAWPAHRLLSAPRGPSINVGIVGAGLAGLACADALAARGVAASVYDANTRTGGRCWSLPGVFPGQVAERGGEFIDNLHKTMLGYARRFGLAVEDVTKEPGEVFYFFGGVAVHESEVVDEFRDFVAAMHVDLRRLSGDVTAFAFTDADRVLDETDLLAYLDGQNGAQQAAGPIARAVISEAYIAEYGLEPDQQSCLNFLQFIHADRRSKFTPFGVFSDERYHVLDGNDLIVKGLTQDLAKPVDFEMMLTAVRRTPDDGVELTFLDGSTSTHDVVVLAIPFTMLREVDLDDNLLLPAGQRDAIAELGYGSNAKMMVGFVGRPWLTEGSNGSSYCDLPHVQTTWETNPTRGTSNRGVLTDFSGGERGEALGSSDVQTEAAAFLTDLEQVFPGVVAAARRHPDDTIVAHLEHWPSNPLTLGSYTCYLPGQFTTIAGFEGLPAGNVYFAGEHANSFYEFQGFMEGAALSGIDAANAILRAAKAK